MARVAGIPAPEERIERTPEEAALLMRWKVFISLRWFGILGTVIATLIASQLLRIGFPTVPVYIVCAAEAAYNFFFVYQLRILKATRHGDLIQSARSYFHMNILFDMAALTALIHFTGGIENPFLFLYVFHIVIASVVQPYRTVHLLATAGLAMILALIGLEYFGVIPHVNLAGFADPALYRQGSYILAVLGALAAIVYATSYVTTAISGELRKRQRQVVELREDLLRQKTGELEQASRELAKLEEEKVRFLRFISIAAHDLKAPLSAIQSYLWVMLGGLSGGLTDKQKNMLSRSTQRINELFTLISDLLDIPRIETGQIVAEMKEISFCEIVESCCENLRERARQKGLDLKVELPRTSPKIRGSVPRLQQVLTNLLNNAIEYTAHGAVTVKAKDGEKDVQVEVADTGIGIPPQDIPRLFEDFFRASNVTTKGTGLGLSITKRIVEAHGGRIWGESPCPDTNCGSRFTFVLPKLL